MLTLETALTRLAANAETIAAFAAAVPAAQAAWKPTPDDWSILEVINHLYDEEREDFRRRVDYTLHRPKESWPPIDPQGWVTARGYNQRDLAQSLADFKRERAESLRWLKTLTRPDWNSTHEHPPARRMTAGEMLAAWVIHDHLHLRQLNELHWQYLASQTEAVSTAYAGGW
jgi:hypothetical protein